MSDSNPHVLLTNEVLKAALKEDLGPQWDLQDFKIKDFTKKGDNYACAVTSVSCTATCNGLKQNTHYVAKLNPLRQLTSMDEVLNDIFIKEGVFLTDVAIKLNDILQSISYPKINFPECVYYSFEKKREIILSRDLRKKGFKMFDRKAGMDFQHSVLLVKELAKLHASSHIFESRLEKKSVLELYPFMQDSWLEPNCEGREVFYGFLKGALGISLKLLKQLKGYTKQYHWLKKLQNQVMDVFVDLIKNCPENMNVICHGDCWNNNVVFRYDDQSNPQEITLLDLQLCRYASLGLDLNYFFYSSLTGDVRNRYYDDFLSVYFQEFTEVTRSANMKMPFTEDELKKEVHEKTLFGIISGLMGTPIMLCESEDAIDLNDMKDGEVEGYMDDYSDKVLKMVDKNPSFKHRFLSIFDDVLEKGFIDK